jgi:hypothetical protein
MKHIHRCRPCQVFTLQSNVHILYQCEGTVWKQFLSLHSPCASKVAMYSFPQLLVIDEVDWLEGDEIRSYLCSRYIHRPLNGNAPVAGPRLLFLSRFISEDTFHSPQGPWFTPQWLATESDGPCMQIKLRFKGDQLNSLSPSLSPRLEQKARLVSPAACLDPVSVREIAPFQWQRARDWWNRTDDSWRPRLSRQRE